MGDALPSKTRTAAFSGEAVIAVVVTTGIAIVKNFPIGSGQRFAFALSGEGTR